ncbi:MAG: S49 family peptidase [Candidatus Hadarchaeia archaeon]
MDKYKIASIIVVAFVIIGWSFIFIQGFLDVDISGFEGIEPSRDREKIAVVRIEGSIENFQTSEKVVKVARDESVEAAILLVNSPGGGVNSSFQLEEAVSALSDKKPTAAIVNQAGASGAYLAISPVDNIFVYEQSLLGSLGVISIWRSLENYYKEEGIEHYVFKTGKYKDMYQPWRGPTDEEEEMIKQDILKIEREMIDLILKNRNLSENEIPERAISGSAIRGDTAVQYGLADNVILTTQEAIDKFTDSIGIEDYSIREIN